MHIPESTDICYRTGFFTWQHNTALLAVAAIGISALVIGLLALQQGVWDVNGLAFIPIEASYALLAVGGGLVIGDAIALVVIATKHFAEFIEQKLILQRLEWYTRARSSKTYVLSSLAITQINADGIQEITRFKDGADMAAHHARLMQEDYHESFRLAVETEATIYFFREFTEAQTIHVESFIREETEFYPWNAAFRKLSAGKSQEYVWGAMSGFNTPKTQSNEVHGKCNLSINEEGERQIHFYFTTPPNS